MVGTDFDFLKVLNQRVVRVISDWIIHDLPLVQVVVQRNVTVVAIMCVRIVLRLTGLRARHSGREHLRLRGQWVSRIGTQQSIRLMVFYRFELRRLRVRRLRCNASATSMRLGAGARCARTRTLKGSRRGVCLGCGGSSFIRAPRHFQELHRAWFGQTRVAKA